MADMSVIFLLIPLSIMIAACFLVAFIWAVRSGQYEDTRTPSMRVLLDDAAPTRMENRRREQNAPLSAAAEIPSTNQS